MRRAADSTLICLFVGLLCVPTARNLAGSQPPTVNENRPLAPPPEWPWQIASLADYPSRFEAFYNDHFGYRHKLIDLLNNVRVRWLHHASSPQVCLGKNGWLYFAYEPVGNDYTTHRPFTWEELERWKRMLEGRRDWLKERGIPYVFVIAPDKQSVYPEMFPRVLRRRVRYSSRLDQLVTYLEENTDVNVLDLREPLHRAKADRRVFLVTDSHWNEHGGYVAYASLITELSRHFPQLRPLPRTEFVDSTGCVRGGDLATMLGLPNRYLEDHDELIPRTPRLASWIEAGVRVRNRPPEMQPTLMVHPGKGLPRAVLFHDSFAKRITPFLGEHFQRLSCRWQEPHEFDAALVESEMPDVVIQQTVERKLGLPFPADCRAGMEDEFGVPERRVARAGSH